MSPTPTIDDAIVIRNVSKHFRKSTIARHHTTVKSELIRWLRGQKRPQSHDFIESLTDVSLTVARGRTIAIIGRNGAGKSTLLKMITGIYRPSSGEIRVNGRISALLDLGAGFHPEFSGRENILINGIILGMSRSEIRDRMDEIIEFSELGDFVDQPVRTYSSGMYMRLAFSVATHVEPDILVIDEILAVGDEHFSRKSRAKMNEFKQKGKTIVLVTHDLGTVERWCDEAAWLDRGRIRLIGEPRRVIQEYQRAVAAAESQGTAMPLPLTSSAGPRGLAADAAHPSLPPPLAPNAPSFRDPKIERVRLLNNLEQEIAELDSEASLKISVDFTHSGEAGGLGFAISLFRTDGVHVWTLDTWAEAFPFAAPAASIGTANLILDRVGLAAGAYGVNVALRTQDDKILDRHPDPCRFRVQAPAQDSGIVRPAHHWSFETSAVKRAAPEDSSQIRPEHLSDRI